MRSTPSAPAPPMSWKTMLAAHSARRTSPPGLKGRARSCSNARLPPPAASWWSTAKFSTSIIAFCGRNVSWHAMNRTSIHRKWRGFTLMEVVVTLAVTSVLFVLGSYVYLVVSARFRKIREDQRFYASFYLFRSALRRDYREAGYAWRGPEDADNVLLLQRGDTVIRYGVTSAYITRALPGRTDTFHLGARLDRVYYYNETIHLITGLRLVHLYGSQTWYTDLERQFPARDV